MTGMFFLYQNVALFLYACLKAFLPLPSLEVVLLPLCLKLPAYWLFFCVIGSFGTMLGGAVGYFLAQRGTAHEALWDHRCDHRRHHTDS